MRSTALLLALFAVARGHPCDDEHGSLCPEHGPDGLAGCLAAAKADGTSISAGCEAWLTMHDACVDDLAKAPCTGTAYGNDAELCLTSWVRKEDLSEACVGGLPAPPEAAEEEEVDEETKNRRAKRKAARKKAAAEVVRARAACRTRRRSLVRSRSLARPPAAFDAGHGGPDARAARSIRSNHPSPAFPSASLSSSSSSLSSSVAGARSRENQQTNISSPRAGAQAAGGAGGRRRVEEQQEVVVVQVVQEEQQTLVEEGRGARGRDVRRALRSRLTLPSVRRRRRARSPSRSRRKRAPPRPRQRRRAAARLPSANAAVSAGQQTADKSRSMGSAGRGDDDVAQAGESARARGGASRSPSSSY